MSLFHVAELYMRSVYVLDQEVTSLSTLVGGRNQQWSFVKTRGHFGVSALSNGGKVASYLIEPIGRLAERERENMSKALT